MISQLLALLPLALPAYLIRFNVGPLPTTVLEVYIVTLLVEFTGKYKLKSWREAWSRLGSWRWPILAWTAVTLLEVCLSPSLWTGFGLWRAYVLEPLLVFLMLVKVVRTEIQVRDLHRALFATILVLTTWAVYQFITGQGIPHPWDVAILDGRRATGPFPYPNALSLFIAPVGAWAFCLWLQDRRRLLSLVTAVAALIGILVARSNGGLFAFAVVAVVGLVLSFVRKSERSPSKILSGSVIGVSVIGALAVILKSSWRDKIWSIMSFHDWSGQVRLFQWRETWQMLLAHPLFGAGFGGYPTVFQAFHKATAIEIFQYPHNILLNFWSETGVLGVAVFLWIVGLWFARAYRKADRLGTFTRLAPLLVILIHGLVDVPYFKNDLAILFWLLIFFTTFEFVPENKSLPA